MSNSITASAYYDKLTSFPSGQLVKILNPLSNDLNAMRQTLLFGGLEAIIHNINRKNSSLRLFEYGNCYSYNKEKTGSDPLSAYHEEFHIGLFLTGLQYESVWAVKEEKTTFFRLKGYVENVLLHIGIDLPQLKEEILADKEDVYSNAIRLRHKEVPVAEMGLLSKQLTASFDIKTDVFYADLLWENLMQTAGNISTQYTELPRFPEVKRDLALLLDKGVTFQQVKELAYRTEKQLLKKVLLFDVYEDEKIGPDKKSYAVSFILQDLEKTLTDERIDKTMKNLMNAFSRDLKAEIR
jgi:phenylalanyl-tRNA synthetase beta chain